MENFLWAILVVVILGFLAIVYFLNKKFEELGKSKKEDQALQILNQGILGMQQRIDKTTEAINKRLDNAASVIGAVNKELGEVQEIGRQMKDLQDFLRSPKLRGNIGEQVLRDLLSQHLPKDNYAIQYKFKNGQVVDAVIKIDQGLIPIDSKFPMENFKKIVQSKSEEEKKLYRREFCKDTRKHVTSIASKYILPQEGTLDFAVMYVPSEVIYYEIMTNEEDLDTFAHSKKVMIVSPNSFNYFLRVILMGLEGKKLSQASRQILDLLNVIRQESMKFGESLSVLSRHVTNAKSAMDNVNSEYDRFSSKIDGARFLKPEEKEKISLEKIEETDKNKEELEIINKEQ